MTPEELETSLRDAVATPRVERLHEALISVLLPDPGMAHNYVQVLVERLPDASYRLTDAMHLKRLVGDGRTDIMRWLRCAGAAIEADGDHAVLRLASDEDLAQSVLTFARYIASASILWEAEPCMTDDDLDAVQAVREPSPVKLMADEMRERILSHLGQRVAPMVRRNFAVRAAGERARAPLAIAPPHGRMPPRLIASFIDSTAEARSVSAAKKNSNWLFAITAELSIPKFLMVEGSSGEVQRLQHIFDHENVVTLPFRDGDNLLEEVRARTAEFSD